MCNNIRASLHLNLTGVVIYCRLHALLQCLPGRVWQKELPSATDKPCETLLAYRRAANREEQRIGA